ncbi:MAG: RHS repeat-associated core domain-containing protein, partial [Anaerolineaceae bacterium]|nr:RHS repeat-associated core domain-containing protein [Anaerolineaceae bacterium]
RRAKNLAWPSASVANPDRNRLQSGFTRRSYYRARYYDPSTGRFLSQDPTEFKGGVNFYAYVGNNAINRTDPDGEAFVDCVQALADLQASTARLAARVADAAVHGGGDFNHKKSIRQAANQVKKDLDRVTDHCGCYVALAAEIALAIEAAEAALAAAGALAAA